MMKQPNVRPARAAIAAVLAFAPTSLLAQEVAPAAPPPVTVTQAAPPPVVAPTAAPTPVMAAPAPVVQQTPAPAPVVAEAAPEAPAPRAERVNQVRAAPVRATPATPSLIAPAVAPAADVSPTMPVEAAAPAAPFATAAPTPEAAPVLPSAAETGNGLEWGLAGGALVLFAGVGLMAMRRRRRPEETPVVAETTAVQPTAFAHEVALSYVREPQPMPLTPAMAAPVSNEHGHGSLETMAAAAPSRENPFLTRKNRLRRAHFLLRQQDAPTAYYAPAAAAAAETQNDRRQSVTYDFGKAGMSQRRGFRPATT